MANVIETGIKRIIVRYPFFASLLLSSTVSADSDVETAATDGEKFYFNGKFLSDVKTACGWSGVEFVVAHETLHAALQHPLRRDNRDTEAWNIAVDYVVNNTLTESGMTAPSGKFTPRFIGKFQGMSAEQIYAHLLIPSKTSKDQNQDDEGACGDSGDPNNNRGNNHDQRDDHDQSQRGQGKKTEKPTKKNKNANNKHSPAWGEHNKWENISPAKAKELERIWRGRLSEALRAAKEAGKLPGGLDRLVTDILRPEFDWRSILASYVAPDQNDYVWKPDRRMWPDIFLPDFGGEKLEDIVIAIDTSGSIEEKQIDAFLTEVYGILRSFPRAHCYLATADAEVQGWEEIDVTDEIPMLKIKGCGGTDFQPVFQKIKSEGIIPKCVIYLTDGFGAYPKGVPHYTVLWVLTEVYKKPPFGEICIM